MKQLFNLIIFCFVLLSSAHAQITAQQKSETIDSVVKLMNERYTFPETARQIELFLRKQQAANVYDSITDGNSFAAKLTNDIRSICNDKHVTIRYSPEVLPVNRGNMMQISEEERKGYAEFLRLENYGVTKLEVLKGNVGYIDFKFLCGTEYAGDFYAAMMNYVQHTDALIIDFRKCGGAMSDNVIPFLCSYFFADKTHLNDLYWREGNFTQQTWTQVVVPGKKYLNKPVYILTSGRTFSGAEEMAYDLKNLKRATIIGDVTGGGANPGGSIDVTSHFNMFLPIGRAINPITKTNWEGAGVQPDTLIQSRLALHKAHLLAMQQSMQTTTNAQWKDELKRLIAEHETQVPLLVKVTFRLKGYATAKNIVVAGGFNDWSVYAAKMKKTGNEWIVETEAEPGKHLYKFVVDGEWILDPANKQRAWENGYENSVIVVK
ncbi:MAG: S41 family peptidase [Lacibacter sp.]